MSIAALAPLSTPTVTAHRRLARVAVRLDLAEENRDSRTLELVEALRRLLLPAVPVSTVHIHPEVRAVFRGAAKIALTRLEFDLLLFFAEHPVRVFRRSQLLGAVWGNAYIGERTVDVHVRRLREKLGEEVPLLATVHGVGYRLDDDADLVIVRTVHEAAVTNVAPEMIPPITVD
ncbi:winged helix-turn-helix domain-containing protein [Micromonospora sp. NBC_01699]|uniref:winged helix-turn-helix domain-containing protein n=1 Tax=Micromonospora sp. NBC_01699 TaxID=2975984 RepID=UPI002E29E75D|nr:winged helix-turn-helix domain-containing protein [Micromonospora sp. NBC_01699]